jgi:hypothetical protein
MKDVYDELNQYVEENVHDAIKDVVETGAAKSIKIANFVVGYAKICSKFVVETD